MSRNLEIVLKTTITLVDQFLSILSSAQTNSKPTTGGKDNELDPLQLLSASGTALKSHVTKLSLLTITAPFTPSAVATPLSAFNESVLPSLITATLLVTPETHTKAFQTEVHLLTGTALKELSVLVKEVQIVSGSKTDEKPLEQSEKDTVTIAAGRVWDACDVLIDIANKGVVGFMVRRAEEYRDLVRDAVEEIEGWDPDEGDEFFDDLLDGDENEAGESSDDDSDGEDKQSAALLERKKDALRILKPIAQIYPGIINNRLIKAPISLRASNITTLELLMKNLQQIPGHIDEVAGALYEADLDKCLRQLVMTKGCACTAIDLVVLPWEANRDSGDQEDAGDKFTTWSNTWIKVVEGVSSSIDNPPNSTSG
ncbi:hypothetical protein BJX99DRAFT_230041 [Aspergillus californicus]